MLVVRIVLMVMVWQVVVWIYVALRWLVVIIMEMVVVVVVGAVVGNREARRTSAACLMAASSKRVLTKRSTLKGLINQFFLVPSCLG